MRSFLVKGSRRLFCQFDDSTFKAQKSSDLVKSCEPNFFKRVAESQNTEIFLSRASADFFKEIVPVI